MKKIINILSIFILCFIVTGCNDNPITKEKIKEIEVVEPEEQNYKMSVITFGDALIHSPIFMDAKRNSSTYNFKKMFGEIEKIIKDYDLKFYNQETVIGGSSFSPSGYPTFNSPDSIGNDLISIGFNVVNLASNHTMDKGTRGASYSASFWNNKEGVYAVGGYRNKTERDEVIIQEMNGITYTILAYTYGTNGIPVPYGYEYLVNVYNDAQAKKDIEKVRDKVDVVMVSMHWGTEYTHTPTAEQQRQAKYLASLGVDVIIGHHAHVIQPVTFIDDTLVIYSLGNMISNQRVLGVEKNIGLAVAFDIEKNVKNNETKISVTNVKGDLIWTKSDNAFSSLPSNYSVIPFTQVTDSMLKNSKSVYTKYCGIINQYKNDAIKVGFFE